MPLFAWALVLMVASYAIQAILVKPQPPQAPTSLEDFDFPQADEGTPQAVYFGDCWTEGWMVLWYGNYRTTKIKSKGKK
jgi:hypothetical protein